MDRKRFFSTALLAPFVGYFLQSCYHSIMRPKYKFAISTYSYWHFRDPNTGIPKSLRSLRKAFSQ
ncbi:MAG: hypothetical protein VX736_04615 [Candidatus Neomarinimicrobiota bacterium]|nr:hypothetical protein [Candidatus Neomarinimicrobiota bacterium]